MMPFTSLVFRQSILMTLSLAGFIFSCSTPQREWEICQISTPTPDFNGTSYFLCSGNELNPLELEVTRTLSGVRFYINLLAYGAVGLPEDPSRTRVSIDVDEEATWEVYPSILEGGQRLLFPFEVSDIIIGWINEGRTVTFKVGRFSISSTTQHFPTLFDLYE